ncbi:MAG: AAA family ATPase [Bifidobacteriaceae bacterium]|jgi:DNA polymerase-3 subunit delta'|nr:AAA family ATPase [Bifidobacteriaceae bacterium]
MSLWDNIIDQSPAVDFLKKTVENKNEYMPQSWLITGPPGSGRTTVAKSFAAALEGLETAEQQIPDIHFVTTEKSEYSVADIRSVLLEAETYPVSGVYKIFILEDVDRMSPQAANLFLKNLEEPDDFIIWILCTTNPRDVLVTIRSRCTNVELKTPSAEKIASALEKELTIPKDLAITCARVSGNHIGLAKRYAKNPKLLEIRTHLLSKLLSISSFSDAVLLADDVEKKANASAKQLTEELEIDAKEKKRQETRIKKDEIDLILISSLTLYRDLFMVKTALEESIINWNLKQSILQASQEISNARILWSIEQINDARRRIKTNAQTLLTLEALFASLNRRL